MNTQRRYSKYEQQAQSRQKGKGLGTQQQPHETGSAQSAVEGKEIRGGRRRLPRWDANCIRK